ncbi:outer membrane beta-barrel protein [Roseivirga sp.]|uniref:outer membrane beta-barrel protein n=1 Tax=Roseivirga sp. TaxID=1964215 RepID=UPI003B8CBACC
MDKSKPQGGDPLDQLAREAAAGAHFEFNPAAWSAMEAKMAPPKRVIPWWKIGGGLGVIAIIIFLIFRPVGESRDVLNENGATQTNSKQLESSRTAEPEAAKDSENTLDGESSKASVKQGAEKSSESSKEASGQQASTNQNETQENKTVQIDQKEAQPFVVDAKTNTINAGNTTSNNELKEEANKKTDQNAQQKSVAGDNSNDNKEEAIKELNANVNSKKEVNYFELSQPNAVNDSIGKREADLYGVSFETITPEWFPPLYLFDQSIKPMTLDSGNYRTPKVDSMQQLKKWSFGVMVSLDLSATGLDGFTKPGTMLGLVAEYRIANNWTLQSGLTYAVKRYSALGSEYNTSAWPGGRSDNLIRAEAVCFVIDIPINLRRYFNTKNGNQWFIGGGVSTYLMLREDYDYEYTRPSPNWAPTSQIRGENNHLLGIANFSVGYETGISKKFKLGIEPFMKLPLTGIGQGEVKFLSFGTNLVLKLK